MKKSRLAGLLTGLMLLFFTISCQKEASNSIPAGKQRVSIRMSDNPVNFSAVNVDIRTVEVLVLPDSCSGRGDEGDEDDDDQDGDHDGVFHDHDGDHDHHDFHCAVWDTLNIRPGVYNLLHLTNGADTILASGFTAAGDVKKIRLTLGTQNSVVIDGVQYPLSLWNNFNRVTIQVKGDDIDQITRGDLQIWLDFNAGESIVNLFNNHFVLKPFLRIWVPAQTASISGIVLPAQAQAVVSAYANADTLVAFPDDDDGRFKIRGLEGTTATVFINATANGYHDTTITAVPLQRGMNTDIGTIHLHN